MLDSEDFRLWRDNHGHGSSKVACAAADVKRVLGSGQFAVEELECVGVHVGGRDGGPIADRLRGVLVGRVGGVVLAINPFHDFGNLWVFDDPREHEGMYEIFLRFIHESEKVL